MIDPPFKRKKLYLRKVVLLARRSAAERNKIARRFEAEMNKIARSSGAERNKITRSFGGERNRILPSLKSLMLSEYNVDIS